MAGEWIRAAKGVRYREHETRKHGKRPDRYYALQYKLKGKVINEAVGWNSDGVTQADCERILAQLRDSWRTGSGPQTLAELRAANIEAQADAQREKEAQRKADVSLREYFEGDYMAAQTTKKQSSIDKEKMLFSKWIFPFFGDVPLRSLDAKKVEAFQTHIKSAGKSDATARYCLAVLSQVWNKAFRDNIVHAESPVKRVKKVRGDNMRIKFLSREDAKKLLEALKERSIDTHDAALLSLFSGLRFGEIHALQWADIDFEHGTMYVKDPKNKASRHANMTREVRQCLEARYQGQHKTAFVFEAKTGGKREWISSVFKLTVKELGLNNSGEVDAEGNPIELRDARQRIVFHTLRHTFASWLAQAGTPIFTLSKLMGHQSITMTQRYSHMSPDAVKQAALALEGALDEPGKVARVTQFNRAAV